MRHGLAVLVLLAVLTPFVPVAGGEMACCRGGGESCVCPLAQGFARCDVTPTLNSPQTLPALLPPSSPSLVLHDSYASPVLSAELLASRAPAPSVPPPRF